MRFVCQHCASKYTIADEKVRNKILKIRCKKCGNIIEVRDASSPRSSVIPPPADAAATPDEQPQKRSVLEGKFAESFKKSDGKKVGGTPGLYQSVKQSAQVLERKETERVQWFIAINDTPAGPVSAYKIHAHRKAKRVDDDSLVWKEGMADWVSMRNCKELIGLLATIDIEELEAKPGEKEPAEDKPRLGLFAEQAAAEQSPLKGKSVGAIASRIDERDEAEKFEKAEDATGDSAAPGSSDSLDWDMFKEAGFSEDLSTDISALHSLSPLRSNSQNRLVMFSAIGFFTVALIVLLVVLFGGGGESSQAPTVKTVEKIVEKVVYRDRIIEKEVERDDEGEEDATGKAAKKSAKKRVAAAPPSKKGTESKLDAKTRALMEKMGMNTPGSSVPIGSSKRSGSKPRGGGAASALSASQVKSVVNRNRGQLKSCYERALKQGEAPPDKDIRVDFKLQVSGSGLVRSVKVNDRGAGAQTLKACLTRSVKKWVFPSSTSDSPVEFPFVFTPR